MKKYKLGDILELQRGYDLPLSQQKTGNVLVAGSNGIIGSHNEARSNHPCITVGRSGSVGKVHYYEQPTWAHNTTLFVKDFKGNSPRYLYYFLKNLHLDKMFAKGSSVVPSLDRKVVHSLVVPFPKDIVYQKQIASVLSNLDRKIALNRSINHNLEAMAKQLYDYWFVQFDFPDENGKPYKSSGGKMVWNEKLKREIPEGWEVASLNRELEIKSGYAFKSESYSSEGRFKIVTIKNVQDGYLDISTCECIETLPKDIKKWCILQKGDRLISLTGNCGRVCRVTSEALLLNQRVGVFCSNELFSEYFFQFLASNEGNRYCVNLANGAAQANLSPIDLCKMESIYPSRETLSLFNKIVQPIIQQYIANEQKMENLTKLRDSLLPLLMNGQVSVNYDLSNDRFLSSRKFLLYMV